MYQDLRQSYWWNGMKKVIAEMAAKCPNCQQVKSKNQRPGGLTQYIELPLWKWDMINMDFITNLPHTPQRFDYIWYRYISYEDVRRWNLEFDVKYWVFLKVLPMKGIMRFRNKGKLSPRYIGPINLIQKIGMVAYYLDFPSELQAVHPVFHVSMLKKCIGDPSRIMPIENICIAED
ncbi:uncharacterized protein [Solanum lycopersicum]|uniref:uncharacterized protein n=1 Tax=Solanum lycopersicum TaxID=4081 RepID=UPI0037479B9A